mgnify:CR=1 FL=1
MPERPIRDMLSKYSDRNPVRFHMPGHKGFLSAWDVTELGITDDLNSPGTAIRRAQELLAACYQSDKSYFLCGGTTEGLKAMFRYLKLTGRSVIMPRHSHRNAFYACIENGIEPVIVDAGCDARLGVLSYEDSLLDAMRANPGAGAVFVTRPDYYGRCLDLKRISEQARAFGMLVLCDSAHGAHFALSDRLPCDASGYADLWVHSAHKTLGALTPSAYLHCSGNIDEKLMCGILPSVRTSSPNYELIMSMDDCRADSFGGRRRWEDCIGRIDGITPVLDSIPGLKVLGSAWAQSAGYRDKDPTRLVLDVSESGGGFYVAKLLEWQDIFVEMADFYHITAILTPYDKPRWYDQLICSLRRICRPAPTVNLPYPEPCKKALPMQQAYFSQGRLAALENATGCISCEPVGAYPPGTPVVLPGEEFTGSAVEYLIRVRESGGALFGAAGGVRVI